MGPQEVIIVDQPTVLCDGGGGVLGHPAVYLKFKEALDIVCPYCSRRFVLAEGAERAAGH